MAVVSRSDRRAFSQPHELLEDAQLIFRAHGDGRMDCSERNDLNALLQRQVGRLREHEVEGRRVLSEAEPDEPHPAHERRDGSTETLAVVLKLARTYDVDLNLLSRGPQSPGASDASPEGDCRKRSARLLRSCDNAGQVAFTDADQSQASASIGRLEAAPNGPRLRRRTVAITAGPAFSYRP